jgi:hypothetical protein
VGYDYAVWNASGVHDSNHTFQSLDLDQLVSVSSPPYAIGERYQLVLRAINAAGLQTVVRSKPVLIASPDIQIKVLHESKWVSDVSKLAGSIVASNTTGYLTSLRCNAGTQRYGQQITQSRATSLQSEMLLSSNSEYTVPISCSANADVVSRVWDNAEIYLTATVVLCTGKVSSAVSEEAAHVDTSKPHGGFIHFLDAHGKRVDTHWDATNLMLQWAWLADEQSGIERCELGVIARNSSHEASVYPFTQLSRNQSTTNIILDAGPKSVQAILATLKCRNKAGLWGLVTSSLTIDTSPPEVAQIVHVTQDGHRNMTCQHALDVLAAVWESFTDKESGVDRYEYSVALLNGPEVLGWKDVGNFTTATARGLNLTADMAYVVRVRAWNKAGLSSVASSTGVVARPSQPDIVSVTNDMGDVLPLSTSEKSHFAILHVSVSGYATRVVCSISTSSHTSEVVSVHTRTGNHSVLMTNWNVTCNLSNYMLYSGHAYFIGVSAYACSELDAPSSFLHRVLYDTSAPLNGRVRAERKMSNNSVSHPFSVRNLVGVGYVSENDSLNVSWGSFIDLEDVIVSYNVTLAKCTDKHGLECAHKQKLASLNSSGSSLQIHVKNLTVEHDVPHAVQVAAANSAGLTKTARLVMILDSTPPKPGSVFNTEAGASNIMQASCLSKSDTVAAAWEGFADEESPLVGYEWSAGTSPSGTELVKWTPVDVATTHASSVLDEGTRLEVGATVYVAVRVSCDFASLALLAHTRSLVVCKARSCLLHARIICQVAGYSMFVYHLGHAYASFVRMYS